MSVHIGRRAIPGQVTEGPGIQFAYQQRIVLRRVTISATWTIESYDPKVLEGSAIEDVSFFLHGRTHVECDTKITRLSGGDELGRLDKFSEQIASRASRASEKLIYSISLDPLSGIPGEQSLLYSRRCNPDMATSCPLYNELMPSQNLLSMACFALVSKEALKYVLL